MHCLWVGHAGGAGFMRKDLQGVKFTEGAWLGLERGTMELSGVMHMFYFIISCGYHVL